MICIVSAPGGSMSYSRCFSVKPELPTVCSVPRSREMSLLSSVERLIKMYKDEQVQINARTEVYREILRSLTPEPKTSSDGSEPADEAAAEVDVSPQEKEDIDLLERVLQKALQVRTSAEPSKADSGGQKLSGPGREISVSSAAVKGRKPTAMKSAFKSASLDRKQQRKPGSCSTLGSRPSAASKPNEDLPSSSDGPALLSRNHQLRGDLSRAASGSTASDCRELQQSRKPSEHAARWRSGRNKQNRLWDKVTALQRNSAPGRSVFMVRLRALFPSEWPSGSPDQTRAVDRRTHRDHQDQTRAVDRRTHRDHQDQTRAVDRRTHRDHQDQTRAVDRRTHRDHQDQTRAVDRRTHRDHQDPRSRTPETASESGGRDEEFGSCEMPPEIQTSAHRVDQEWKAWDRWRPEGGRLCPAGVSARITAPLPLTVTYTTEAELQQLEELRLKVALLQQDVHVEQVLLDCLSPRLWSGEPGGLDLGVLRDLYSLLAEGGLRFPAVVLDSE